MTFQLPIYCQQELNWNLFNLRLGYLNENFQRGIRVCILVNHTWISRSRSDECGKMVAYQQFLMITSILTH